MKQFDYSLIMEPVSCDVAALPLTVTADVGSEMIFFLHMWITGQAPLHHYSAVVNTNNVCLSMDSNTGVFVFEIRPVTNMEIFMDLKG